MFVFFLLEANTSSVYFLIFYKKFEDWRYPHFIDFIVVNILTFRRFVFINLVSPLSAANGYIILTGHGGHSVYDDEDEKCWDLPI